MNTCTHTHTYTPHIQTHYPAISAALSMSAFKFQEKEGQMQDKFKKKNCQE